MERRERETLIFGGTVLTMMDDHPGRSGRPDAVLIRGNRIAAVGREPDLRSMLRAGEEDRLELDLRGRTVMPGFNDNHIHAVHMGDHESRPNLDGLAAEEIVDLLKTRYREAEPGTWIFGYSWDYPSVPNPHRQLLDRAFPDNPVLLTQFSGHAAWLNGTALSHFGIDRDTPDWPKGKILKDDSGEPTGIIREPTSNPKIRAFYFKRWTKREFIEPALRAALPALAKAGITSIQDNTWFPQALSVIRDLHTEGVLTCRFSCWPYGESRVMATLFRLRRFNRDWYDLGPTKFFLDGAFSSRSAWLTEPYADEPDNTGSGRDSETIERLLAREVRRRRQCAHHSIGDRATAELCDAVERMRERYPSVTELRLRIEHGQIIRDEDIPRLRDLGILVCAQPSALVDPEKDERLLGARRARKAYPYRSLLDAGVHLSFGSDYPGEHVYEPLHSIRMVTDRDGPERITAAEALRAFTVESAYAQFAEDRKGTLEKGKLADLVVLSDDPTSVRADRISVERTIVDGKTVFEAPDQDGVSAHRESRTGASASS